MRLFRRAKPQPNSSRKKFPPFPFGTTSLDRARTTRRGTEAVDAGTRQENPGGGR